MKNPNQEAILLIDALQESNPENYLAAMNICWWLKHHIRVRRRVEQLKELLAKEYDELSRTNDYVQEYIE